jgi:iron complex outermembrane receptor protein
MNKTALLLLLIIPVSSLSFSQETISDSAKNLSEVVVNAYEQNRKLKDVSAAIGLVNRQQLLRFSNNNILPALNSDPGVRMEERSPASYRLNIRGSSLRSPFGVRDIKIYWNEIPLTDPGGNTYLNQLSFYNFQSLEIIKGPAGSLYGAGIGGAMLIKSLPDSFQKNIQFDYTYGSYANKSIHAEVNTGNADHRNSFAYSHQSSNGYRVQTQMRRDIATWETLLKASEKQTIHAYMLYGDLYYQTPGALTLAEYNKDPRAARPAAGALPGAVTNKAAIYQKTFIAGFSNEYQFNDHWKNTSSAYGAYTDFTNPSIRVYGKRKEPHFGGRTIFQYNDQINNTAFQINFGAEAQKGFFTTQDFKNNKGNADSLQTDDAINNWQYMIFAQGDIRFSKGWSVTGGASFNKSSVQFTRLSVVPTVTQQRNFENKIAPRLAVLKKINNAISAYVSVAKGFSTPTVAELLKSSGTIGNNLQPEDGIDHEIGARGSFLNGKLYFDINAFFFHLNNYIVQRIDTNAVFYFINAGNTKQHGLETFVSYQLGDYFPRFLKDAKIWLSHTWQDFHYRDFKQLSTDFSGKQLPGVPPQTVVAGLDIFLKKSIYANITYTYTDAIYLNDANTVHANSYNLLDARIGYRTGICKRFNTDLYLGANNLFNTKYSLGNDINAAAGRYYNAAPGINYFAGISIRFH